MFVFLGFVSFSFYLIHPLVIGAFSCPLMIHLTQSMTYNKAGLIVLISTVIFALAISWVMAKTVDKFSVDITKRIFGSVKSIPIKANSPQAQAAKKKNKK